MPPSHQEVNRGNSYCGRCGSYNSRTESDEIKELRGAIETKTAELRGRDNIISKLRRDLDQMDPEAMFKETVTALKDRHSRETAAWETKVQELEQALAESKVASAATRRGVEDTSQQIQDDVTTRQGTREECRDAESENKKGADKRQAHEIISETAVNVTAKDSRIVDLESRNRELKQALDEKKQEMDRYRDEAHMEENNMKDLTAKWNVWLHQHSSCTDRITALETRNHDVEQAYDDLKSKYSHVQRIHSSCGDEMVRLTEEASRVIALESRNHELQRDVAIITQRYKQWKADANAWKWDFEEAQRTHSSTLKGLQDEIHNQTHGAQSARQRAEELKYALEELQQIHSSTIELLEARTKELTLAQQFLTTADSVAGAEVIRLVEKLNGEILQCAAQLADTLPPSISNAEAMQADTNDQRIMIAATEIHDLAGERVIDLLQTARNTEGASIAVQIAVQACLVSFCERLVRFWHYGNDPQIEGAFQDLYDVLRSTVTMSIAVKWRALTKSNLDRLRDRKLEQNFASHVVLHMLQKLSAIVLFTGYPGIVAEEMANRLSSSLQSITKSVLELRTTIGEKALFCDLEMFLYSPGTPFDGNVMGNSFESGRQSHGRHASANAQPILCTTDLGLRQFKVAQAGNRVEEITLVPKVVLESVIGDIL